MENIKILAIYAQITVCHNEENDQTELLEIDEIMDTFWTTRHRQVNVLLNLHVQLENMETNLQENAKPVNHHALLAEDLQTAELRESRHQLSTSLLDLVSDMQLVLQEPIQADQIEQHAKLMYLPAIVLEMLLLMLGHEIHLVMGACIVLIIALGV